MILEIANDPSADEIKDMFDEITRTIPLDDKSQLVAGVLTSERLAVLRGDARILLFATDVPLKSRN